jgi:hypothetical protein
MRKALLLGAVAASALIAASAWADVDVTGTVTKDQTITVNESLTKYKTINVTVGITLAPEKFAEASTHYNQENVGNLLCENCAEKTDLITGSILRNVGITSVNQASGNNNNQGTVISFALDHVSPPPPPDQPPPEVDPTGGFAESQVAGSQNILSNTVRTAFIVNRDALIENSINGNTGITAVNQASGNANNQANAISIGLSLESGVALSDGALGQLVSGNVGTETSVSKSAQLLGSIKGNTGITQVNQSAGNLGNQSNAISLAIASPIVPATTP